MTEWVQGAAAALASSHHMHAEQQAKKEAQADAATREDAQAERQAVERQAQVRSKCCEWQCCRVIPDEAAASGVLVWHSVWLCAASADGDV